MRRLLFFILIATIIACQTESNLPMAQMPAKFQQSRHDAALDQKIQHILNQYFAVMAHLAVDDSADLQLYGANLMQLSDSLSQQTLSLDSATQTSALQGLMNIQSEMQAILMESDVKERLIGAQMLTLHWIAFLTSIGYQKQTVYIFSDRLGNQWLNLNKKSSNPYQQNDPSIYQASQVVQELK